MRLPRLTAFAMTIAMTSALPAVADPIPDPTTTEADDAVVIAVVDSGFSPYHLDFRADLMPQHLDGDPSNDLPLDTDPADWLPGYADAVGVASTGAIDLTLTTDTSVPIEQLEDADNAHDQLPQSSTGDVHMRHIPGTKIVGPWTSVAAPMASSGPTTPTATGPRRCRRAPSTAPAPNASSC